MLDSLSLVEEIDGLGSLLNLCKRMHVLSMTYLESQQLTLPPTGKLLALESLSLSGNITNPGTLLNRCPCLRVLTVTFSRMALASLEAALSMLVVAAPVGVTLSLLGINIPWRAALTQLASLLFSAPR